MVQIDELAGQKHRSYNGEARFTLESLVAEENVWRAENLLASW